MLKTAIDQVLDAQLRTRKPLAIILAGHNGSGKSTMWRQVISSHLQIPLINADRMMLSILPEPNSDGALSNWAQHLRDNNQDWMRVAQNGVQAFVGHAMQSKVPFAMETVFSHLRERPDGSFESKVDLILDMQRAGYFVLLLFVGLTDENLSILRVQTRVAENGHDVGLQKLLERFPRTQVAIKAGSVVADATIFTDNSRDKTWAFTVCRVQIKNLLLFDIRNQQETIPKAITKWLGIVAPNQGQL